MDTQHAHVHLARTSTALRIEIVYAANVVMTHRFITWQTRTSAYHTHVTLYTKQQYDVDVGMVFDHFIVAPGNTMARHAHATYDVDKHDAMQRIHAQHVYEPERGPVRATLMWVTRSIPTDENLWPAWAAQAYAMLTETCDDIGINTYVDESVTHTTLNASLLTSPQRPRFNSLTSSHAHKYMPSFREIRPLSAKPAHGDVITLGSGE